jgi:hypothetical protein
MSFKQRVYSACLELVNEKLKYLNPALDEWTAGAQNDSKSSAGDKHETTRAMMQLEHEKIGRQREEFLRLKKELERIVIARYSGEVIKGSLIKTNNGYLFLAIAIGKINIEDIPVTTLSPQSPLGQKLAGKREGSTVEMNGLIFRIEKIL